MSATTSNHITIKRKDPKVEKRNALLKTFGACMAFAFVLALMVGNQEGTQKDFGYAFREAIFGPRIVFFLLIGVLVFASIVAWPVLRPYVLRPGVRPLIAGALTILVSLNLLHWTDHPSVQGGKFSTLANAARDTGNLDPVARLFFGSPIPAFPWLLFALSVGLVLAGIRLQKAAFGYAGAGVAVVAGVLAIYTQAATRAFLARPDHATGGAVAMLGFFTIAAAGVINARSKEEAADTSRFIQRVFGWRPGMPLVAMGLIVGLVGVFSAAWFSPLNKDSNLPGTAKLFSGSGLDGFSSAYLGWLGIVLFFLTLGVALAASYLKKTALGWVAIALGAVSALLTLYVMQAFATVAADKGFDGAKGHWGNLGTGGWLTAAAFALLAAAGWLVVVYRNPLDQVVLPDGSIEQSSDTITDANLPADPGMSQVGLALMMVMMIGAVFVPPTTTLFWQTVLVTQVGIYVLLAIGLNVVVGWAGLLDLGYIAFYAIGSYTTAYLTGRLPIKPPEWLIMNPLLAIPFAVVICLIAGVILGWPTLRLRGDYLAIVTLGFGEIIRVVANNSNNVTNGPRGAFNIPNPSINIGPIHLQWGNSPLGFWYLLLILVVIVVVLFNRLENSRLGRAWAAIREDEVAAQATGVNTFKCKLLAFGIGASTSGVAGVFFASQVGSFTPENFLLVNSILVVAYVVFGGMGSLPGAMAGAAVLTWLPEFLKEQVPAEDRQMWIGALLLGMMIFRPAGLIPARRRKAELSGLDRADNTEIQAVPAAGAM